MARWPAPGRCKGRLARGLGDGRAAQVQRALTAHTLATASSLAATNSLRNFEVVLAVSGLAARAAQRWSSALGADRMALQGSGSLGLRLQRQVHRGLREGAPQVVVIGSDLPGLEATDLEQAFAELGSAGAEGRSCLVLGPASDGGYWLVGLNRSWPRLFAGIPWGSERVLAATTEQASALGIKPHLLQERSDLDWPADLVPWR
ncbi:TIGR04282 family arsenosugar biosynthesis glycosyltransferase [Cyanobium sp. WAJ14-Wanaka]|nr:TIGR04282 family arsenosugar biosynthesis glycosyltransferase [Cyanobium sp. WAJ14-Wanaka]